MSRETLDDEPTSAVRGGSRGPGLQQLDRRDPRPVSPSPRGNPPGPVDQVLELDVGTEPEGPDVAAGEPPTAPWYRRHRPTLVACALTALLVGLLTAVVSPASSGGVDPGTGPRLVGGFLPSNWSTAVNGVVPFSGRVQVVNAGAQPVEIWRADLFGVTGEEFLRPVLVQPGEVGAVAARADVPCRGDVDPSIVLGVRVVADDGAREAMTDQLLATLVTDQWNEPSSLVLGACSVQPISGSVRSMTMDRDGRLLVTLASEDGVPAELVVVPVGGSGLEVVGAGAREPSLRLPEGGVGDAAIELRVADCESVGGQLAAGGGLLEPHGSGGVGWVDGWDPSVAAAAVGFAYARDCA